MILQRCMESLTEFCRNTSKVLIFIQSKSKIDSIFVLVLSPAVKLLTNKYESGRTSTLGHIHNCKTSVHKGRNAIRYPTSFDSNCCVIQYSFWVHVPLCLWFNPLLGLFLPARISIINVSTSESSLNFNIIN